MNAEPLYDAINQVANTPVTFSGMPTGTRAVQLPDSGFNDYFLMVFGKPQAASACECERSDDANLAQSLHLLNSTDIQGKPFHDSDTGERWSEQSKSIGVSKNRGVQSCPSATCSIISTRFPRQALRRAM